MTRLSVIIMLAMIASSIVEAGESDVVIQSFNGYEFGKSYELSWHTNEFGLYSNVSNDGGRFLKLVQTQKGRLCSIEIRKRLKTVPAAVPASEKEKYDRIAFGEVKSEIDALESRYNVRLRQHTFREREWGFGNGKSILIVEWFSTTDIMQTMGKPEQIAYIVCIRAERADILNEDTKQPTQNVEAE